MNNNLLVSLKNLSVRFKQGSTAQQVVNAISFDIQRGETLALVGESHWAVPLAILIFAAVIAGLYARLRRWSAAPLA